MMPNEKLAQELMDTIESWVDIDDVYDDLFFSIEKLLKAQEKDGRLVLLTKD